MAVGWFFVGVFNCVVCGLRGWLKSLFLYFVFQAACIGKWLGNGGLAFFGAVGCTNLG